MNNCLNTLHTLAVGGLDGITTNDICAGRLRTILDLFYALSAYKQAAKQKSGVSITKQQQQQQQLYGNIQASPAATQATQPIHQPVTQQQQQQIASQPNTVNASNEMLNR